MEEPPRRNRAAPDSSRLRAHPSSVRRLPRERSAKQHADTGRDTADPVQRQAGGGECRLEHGRLVGGQRDEQSAGRLGIERQRFRGVAGRALDVRPRVLAVAAVTARADACLGELECAEGSAGSEAASSSIRTPLRDAIS